MNLSKLDHKEIEENIKLLQELGLDDRAMLARGFNPLSLVAHDEFNAHGASGMTYRKRAIKRVIEAKVSFASDANTLYDLVVQLISVNCPYCNADMIAHGGGGSGSDYSIDYHCECGAKINLNFSYDSISVIAPK